MLLSACHCRSGLRGVGMASSCETDAPLFGEVSREGFWEKVLVFRTRSRCWKDVGKMYGGALFVWGAYFRSDLLFQFVERHGGCLD